MIAKPTRTNVLTGAIFLILGTAAVLLFAAGWSGHDDLHWDFRSRAPDDPEKLAQQIVDNDDAHLIAAVIDGTFKVKYSLDPWAMTRNATLLAFEMQTKEIVPAIFNRFHDVQSINIIAEATLQNTRGNQFHTPVLRIEFTRRNANTINWQNVLGENLPRIADNFWQDPIFDRP